MSKRNQKVYTAGYSLVTRNEDGKGKRFRRKNTLEGHVQFDLEHPDPAWTEEYKEWFTRQVLRRLARQKGE